MKNKILLLSIIFCGLFGYVYNTYSAGSVVLELHRNTPRSTIIKSNNKEYRMLKFDLSVSERENAKIEILTAKVLRADNNSFATSRDAIDFNIYESSSSTPINSNPVQIGANGEIKFYIYKTINSNRSKDYSIGCKIPWNSNARSLKVSVFKDDLTVLGLDSGVNISVLGEDAVGNAMDVQIGKPDLIVDKIYTNPEKIEAIDPREYMGEIMDSSTEEDLAVDFTVVVKNIGAMEVDLKDMVVKLYKTNVGNILYTYTQKTSRTLSVNGTYKISFDVPYYSGIRKVIGTSDFIADVDYKNLIEEIDEDNNMLRQEIEVIDYGELNIVDDTENLDKRTLKKGEKDVLIARLRMIGLTSSSFVNFDGIDFRFSNCKHSLENVTLKGGSGNDLEQLGTPLEKLYSQSHNFLFDSQEVYGGVYYYLNVYADIKEECSQTLEIKLKDIKTISSVATIMPLPFKLTRTYDITGEVTEVVSDTNTEDNNQNIVVETPVVDDIEQSVNSSFLNNTQSQKAFSYGQQRISLSVEQAKAIELKKALDTAFNRIIPIEKRFWHIYVNCYVYGQYPVKAIVQSLKLGGKTVHPVIPYYAWKNSADYKEYINK